MTLLERLSAPGPKRILALDGGGIRGTLTAGFLEAIEGVLRERHGRPDLKLCDYFDLIGGTSTGAIIAAALATGKDAGEIKQLYLELGGKVFGKKAWRKWSALFQIGPLQEELERVFGDERLGGDAIRTGLCIVAKRADTGSTWPLHNHPNGAYYGKNKDILLRQAVRASTAAPVYFVPELFDVGDGELGAFVDGGVSMANNPALQLFWLAVLRGYPFRWTPGADSLLLVSVGTGTWNRREPARVVVNGKLWDWARQVPEMLLADASWQNQLVLQSLSRTRTPWEIDSEIGDLSADAITPEPALTYLRYDVRLESEHLASLGFEQLTTKLALLREMSYAPGRRLLAEIGDAAAAASVEPDHFPSAFDLGAGDGPRTTTAAATASAADAATGATVAGRTT